MRSRGGRECAVEVVDSFSSFESQLETSVATNPRGDSQHDIKPQVLLHESCHGWRRRVSLPQDSEQHTHRGGEVAESRGDNTLSSGGLDQNGDSSDVRHGRICMIVVVEEAFPKYQDIYRFGNRILRLLFASRLR